MNLPSKADILSARQRIASYVNHTPVLTSETLDSEWNAQLYFKCENFQKAGAFKSRGAVNAVFSLDEVEIKKGVATHSSGNHAQALARAAHLRQIPAYIVMPQNAPKVKVDAVRGYGGMITFCEPTLAAREATLNKIVAQTGATVIHPYDNLKVIQGQATAAAELIESVPDLDMILCPVGGGGLLSGTALSAQYFSPDSRVIACEPSGADDAYRSFYSGKWVPSENPKTIADGLLTSLGQITYPIIKEKVSAVVTVDEQDIIAAMRFLFERMKIVVEPSAAVTLAAVFAQKVNVANKKIGLILSGGNVDLNHLPFNE